MLRSDGETFVSVNWLEYFGVPERDQQIAEVRKTFLRKKLALGTNAKFAVVPVGSTVQHVSNETHGERKISILEEPEAPPEFEYEDYSHCGIHGIRKDDENTVCKYISEKVLGTLSAKE